jgi:prepilin-type N-terminal cleavage/methylation domain-containing protein
MKKAFTIVELLVVLAIIGILMAIIVPAASGVRRQAAIVQTKARFQRWALALEAFKNEYGNYPDLGSSPVEVNTTPGLWVELLSAHDIEGNPAADSVALDQNPKLIKFIDFTSDELDSDGRLLDGFGRSDITAYFDTDDDGFLDGLTSVRGRVGFKSAGEPTITSY